MSRVFPRTSLAYRVHNIKSMPIITVSKFGLIYWARASLAVSLMAIFCGGPVGTALGLLAGYFGGWDFNDATEAWSFHDPRPIFAETNTLKELVPGEAYFINVNHDQTALLNDPL